MKTTVKSFMAMAVIITSGLSGCGPVGEKEPMVKTDAAIVEHDTVLSAECSCDNSHRWSTEVDGGGSEISPAVGKEMVKAFHDAHTDVIKGGFISKVALDSIFCRHEDYNGLFAYVAQDNNGNQTIVIEGWRSDDNGESKVKVSFNSTLPSEDRYKVFELQTICPTMCGYCGE